MEKKTTKMSRKNRAVVVWVSKEGGIISSKWGKIQKWGKKSSFFLCFYSAENQVASGFSEKKFDFFCRRIWKCRKWSYICTALQQ